nr:hypothetical protein GCM10025732_53330 [Glycomyces mayteni]
MPAQAGAAVLVDGVLHAGAPFEGPAGEGLDLDAVEEGRVDAADAGELVEQDLRLEAALGLGGGVLEVAAAALAGPGPRAGGVTRSGEASRTSTASANAKRFLRSVISMRTRSPGRAWRTK